MGTVKTEPFTFSISWIYFGFIVRWNFPDLEDSIHENVKHFSI